MQSIVIVWKKKAPWPEMKKQNKMEKHWLTARQENEKLFQKIANTNSNLSVPFVLFFAFWSACLTFGGTEKIRKQGRKKTEDGKKQFEGRSFFWALFFCFSVNGYSSPKKNPQNMVILLRVQWPWAAYATHESHWRAQGSRWHMHTWWHLVTTVWTKCISLKPIHTKHQTIVQAMWASLCDFLPNRQQDVYEYAGKSQHSMLQAHWNGNQHGPSNVKVPAVDGRGQEKTQQQTHDGLPCKQRFNHLSSNAVVDCKESACPQCNCL